MKNIKKLFVIKTATLFVDIALIYLTFSLAYWIRFNIEIIPLIHDIPPFVKYRSAIPFVILIWLIIFFQNNIYQLKRSYLSAYDELFRIGKVVTTGTVVVMAATFLYREFSYSRVVIAYAWFLGIVFIFAAHQFLKWLEKIIIRRYSSGERILLIGDGKIANSLKGVLDRHHSRYLQYKGDLDNKILMEFFKEKGINEVILAKFPIAGLDAFLLKKICEENDIEFRLVPDLLELRMGELVIDDYFGIPMMQLKPMSLHGINFFTKRAIDIIFATLFTITFFIPLLVICMLIKLDSPGPVLYIQRRMGYKGRPFPFYKFRTMHMDADHMLEKVKPLNDREGPAFKMKNDPRITRIGRILRRYSMDEIPQIFNILRGEMSLVGPRPQVLWEAEYYDEWAKRRLHVLPGITGLWQISGRSDLSYEEMIRLDIYYIENWSLGLDLKIILKTPPALFSKKGAY